MIQFFANHICKPLLQRYLQKDRWYHYNGIKILVKAGVFHPGFFFSTKFLLQYLLQFDLRGKSLLELGAGSGLISFLAEKNGAIATGTDLSSKVIEGLEWNKRQLQSRISIVTSDLFKEIPAQHFDFIIINPPYYPKKILNEAQLAWNCGQDYEYFSKLFSQIGKFLMADTCAIIILAVDCDIKKIQSLANENSLQLIEKMRRKFWWEWNYIYDIRLK